MSASQRRKGQAAEREVRGLLIDELGAAAVGERRLDQTRDGGHDLDVRGGPRVALEVKRQERAALHTWLDQAEQQAGDGELPAVVWRPSRRGWCVVMALEDWCGLYREAMANETEE